jgi:hypothetical protein
MSSAQIVIGGKDGARTVEQSTHSGDRPGPKTYLVKQQGVEKGVCFMAYKKKTLRRMQPITRRYARIINELDSVLRRLRNLTEDIARLELDSRALYKRREFESKKGQGGSLEL